MPEATETQSTLDQLAIEATSMNAKGAMTAVGINPDDPESLRPLVEIVENHELGATSRAVLIWVRGYLQRMARKLPDVIDDPEVIAGFKQGFSAASSISRAIPLGLAMQEHLAPDWEYDRTVIITLGASRAHVEQVMLHPEILRHEFFQKFRVALDPSAMPKIDQVIAIDRREPSFGESAQTYMTPDGKKTAKVFAMEELEDLGDHEGRLIKILKDIRELTPEELLAEIGNEPANIVIMLNNILYAVSGEIRAEIEATANALAEALGAQIMQMEGWQVFHDEKPEVTLPGKDKPLVLPAHVRVGATLNEMTEVATLDGNTGKPFLLHKKDGSTVFINKDGEEEAIS